MRQKPIGLILAQFVLVAAMLAAGKSMASASFHTVQPPGRSSPELSIPVADRLASGAPPEFGAARPGAAHSSSTLAYNGPYGAIAPEFPAPVSDDFNVCGLDAGLWTYINPLGDTAYALTGTSTANAWLEIEVPGGIRHSLTGNNTDAPRLMQSIDNSDFEIEVKFESGVSDGFQMQGVLIEETPNTRFLRFDFEGSPTSTRIYASAVTAPIVTDILYISIGVTETAPLYMRVKRHGSVFTQTYSLDGVAWITAGSFTDTLTSTAIGVFAGNSGINPAHTAQIDYFFNSASPISPEDGALIELFTETVGSGSVTRNPDLPAYTCGQMVTLTAVPLAGWSFQSWSGGVTGTANPIITTMNGSQTVTATFTEDQYILDTMAAGAGTITKNPDQPTYTFGQVVTLTAIADLGWTFQNWSGAASGSVNPTSVTMNGNRSVTANFTQNVYTLSTYTSGFGSVLKNPDQLTYTYGQVVTLIAAPGVGWTFQNWSGDVIGSVNPAQLMITGDHSVTATFQVSAPGNSAYLPVVHTADTPVQSEISTGSKLLAKVSDPKKDLPDHPVDLGRYSKDNRILIIDGLSERGNQIFSMR